MKILALTLDQTRLRLSYEHEGKENSDGTLPKAQANRRDRLAASLLREWAQRLEVGEYESVGFSSDAKTVRRDELEAKG